jgi:cobalt-zinc-cadmium efflux system protein
VTAAPDHARGHGHDEHDHEGGHAGHHHAPSADADLRWLALALVLIAGFMVVEVVGGLLASSLALLSDAAHMLTDAAAIGLALVAARLAARPARGTFTFGLGRAEILSAQVNGAALLVLAGVIAVEAIRRLFAPPEVDGSVVVAVGLALAAAAAGAVVLVTGFDRADGVAALFVSALMVRSGWGLLRDSARVLLEGAPQGLDPDAIGRAMAAEPGVVEVHDLHVWEVTSGFPAIAAHVLVRTGDDCHAARRRLQGVLGRRFGVSHVTLQVDHAPEPGRLLEIEADPR